VVSGADCQQQRSRGQSSGGARGGRRGEDPRNFVGNCENLRDFTVNRIFPLIQSSNDEVVKIEVVELFKSYNFALGLKFRNLKYTALFYNFTLKSNFR
jgi:hypothetical protein